MKWDLMEVIRDSQKKYFKPQLLKSKNLCEKEELIGNGQLCLKVMKCQNYILKYFQTFYQIKKINFVGCEVAYVLDPTTYSSKSMIKILHNLTSNIFHLIISFTRLTECVS